MNHQSIGKALLCIFLLSVCVGCRASKDAAAPEPAATEPPSVVSSAFRGFGASGLLVDEGERKQSGAAFTDGPVEFQDPAIEEMLRSLIGKPEGEVLRSDLQAIHAVYWRSEHYWSDLQSRDGCLPVVGSDEGTFVWDGSRQPQTLADLSLCGNLQWLEFGEIDLPSLEPLMGLPQLEVLKFRSTVVSEERLAEVARLPALKSLEIDFRDPGDYTGQATGADFTGDGSFILPLAGQLTSLCIDNNLTWSSQVLAQLQNLESLSLNAPQELDFLSSLPNLQKLLLSNCAVSDWSPLGDAVSLEDLYLNKCEGVSLADLRPLTHLDYLDLSLTSFTPGAARQEIIAALPSLTGLYIV